MENVITRILTIIFIVAVLGYVIFNYINGRTEGDFFIVAVGMLSFFLVGMVRGLVEDMRHK